MTIDQLALQAVRSPLRIALRKARPGDAPVLLALHRTALRVLGRSHYSAAQIESVLRHVPTLDDALIDDRTYFVAEADGRIVACGGWSLRTPGYEPVLSAACPAPAAAQRPALIRAMYTHPDWGRRGLARSILAAAESEAHHARSRAIELDALLPGVALYLAAGYEPLFTHSLTLPDGAVLPVVRMRKCGDARRRPPT